MSPYPKLLNHSVFKNTSLLGLFTSLSLAILSLSSFSASAQNLQTNDMSLKTELDWLQAQGVIQISTSTWPLTTNEINRALASAAITTPGQQKILQSVRYTLSQQPKDFVNTSFSAYAQTDRSQLPQSFADDNMANFEATAQAGFSEENWEVNLQANIKEDDLIDDETVSFEGSYVAGKFANQWLIAGQIPSWWGPGQDGSLIRGDASNPVVGVTLQRDTQNAPKAPLLKWIGPWQYQLFAGQLKDYKAVPDTKLIGMRLTASPTQWLELGASRSIMWGGKGRPNNASSLFDAIKGTSDNGGTGKPDPANQLAGFDARVNLNSLVKLPLGIYATYVGEDEAGGLPAKNMYLAGIDYASSLEFGDNYNSMPFQIYSEWTDTTTSGEISGVSYNHTNYTDGFYQQGYPLGYALGGDTQSIAVGGKLWVDSKNKINTKLQVAKVNQSSATNNHAYPQSDTLKVIDIGWQHQLNPKTAISSRVWATDSDLHSSDLGAGLGVEFTNP